MTREEARKLLSRYATGSLTELEQQLLFDAALDDQDLFDELAEEQHLKRLIEMPGARGRLLAALEPPQPAAETKAFLWWPWAFGIAGIASIAMVAFLLRPIGEPPPEVAVALQQPTEPAASVQESVAASPAAEAQLAREPEPELERRAAEAVTTAKESVDVKAEAPAAPTEPVAVASAPQPARKELPNLVPPPAAAAGKGKAPAQFFKDNNAGNVAAARADGFALTATTALEFEVRETGILRITPQQPGFLEVTFDTRPLFPMRAVTPGEVVDISVPLEANRLRIDFARTANAPAGTPFTREETAGFLSLPAGPNQRTSVSIPAQRR